MSKASSKSKRVVSAKKKVPTPESSIRDTPTQSSESVGIDNVYQKNVVDVVIDDEEVAALYLKEEDIIKMHPPKILDREKSSDWPQRTDRVLVKVMQKSYLDRRRNRRVSVLHPIPPGMLDDSKYHGSVPCYDDKGSFIPHSILGTAEDYIKELKNRNVIDSEDNFSQTPHIVKPKLPKLMRQIEMSYKKTIVPREEHALEHWQKSMELRKSQQAYLSEKLEVSPEKLIMNKGEAYRKKQEERGLIDSAIPAVGGGKGYRAGSEFWMQQERIGDEETGILMTLTETEKGLPPDVEFMDVPSIIHKERGTVEWGRNTPSHYTWHGSSYLSARRQCLTDSLAGPQSFRPDFTRLQVIGYSPGTQVIDREMMSTVAPSSRFRIRTDSLDSVKDGVEILGDKDLSIIDLPESENDSQLCGPALMVGSRLLKWMGPPPAPPHSLLPEDPMELQNDPLFLASAKGSTLIRKNSLRRSTEAVSDDVDSVKLPDVVEYRVNLKSEAGVIATAYLEMENCGTTAIYFSWEHIPKPNPLGTVQAGDTQRFYFDTRGGALLPGQKLKFPFMFKSMYAGIFSEIWLLATGPVLNQGRPFIVTLKGIATQDDIYEEDRDSVERILVRREAEAAAGRIMQRLVDSIRTPPQTPPPTKADETLVENFFTEKNPEMFYHYDIIQQLKFLHDSSLFPELFLEEEVPSVPLKAEKSTAKRIDDKSTSGSKKATTAKEKKPIKSEEGPSDGSKERMRQDIPKWDLSIEGLLEIIMNVENEASKRDKLKKLNELVGALSFPPLESMKPSSYHLCYQVMCGAVDSLTDVSTHLCQVMGLPPREWPSDEVKLNAEEVSIISIPASPAPGKSKADRKPSTNKDKKESKKSKEREKIHTPNSKLKKTSRVTVKSEATEIQVPDDETSTVSVLNELNPMLENKYRENFYAAAYRILVSTVDRMVLLMEGTIEEELEEALSPQLQL